MGPPVPSFCSATIRNILQLTYHHFAHNKARTSLASKFLHSSLHRCILSSPISSMAPSRKARGGEAPCVGSGRKARPQNERSRGNPTLRRSPASESQSQEHTSCISPGESRKRGQELDDGSEEGRPRKRARRLSLSNTLSSTPSASNPAPSTSSSSAPLLPPPSFPTFSYSASLASTKISGDTDHDEVEDASSDDVEDEVVSDDGVDNGDIDDDKIEPPITPTLQVTETQTNEEIQTFLDQNVPGCTVIDSTCYNRRRGDLMHRILAQIRLPKKYGGTERATEIALFNNTGSFYQRVFETDLEEIDYNRNTYRGNIGNWGVGSRKSLWVELRLLKPDKTSFGDWFLEEATIDDKDLFQERHTGNQIREEFLFATVPGKQHLYVAKVAHTT